MRSAAAFVIGIALAAPGALAGEPSRMTGAQIETLVSGATMRGDFVSDGSAWAERTTKSGRVMDLLQNGKHVGAWFVAGDRVCYIYFGKPPSTPCYALKWDGDVLIFTESRSGQIIARATAIERSRR